MHVIGTAGHVDHGKSTLVKALTGIDPDRLKEEKERQMTIDLGFAWLRLPGEEEEVGVVDVPGHERLVKNMLAGVGGIDLAMLVVAADEGVMPQTREHLAILDLLRVKSGIVVLTKRDLVDDDWLELVTGEVQEAVAETTLADAPIIAVSSTTGEGLESLKALLAERLQHTEVRKDAGRPRLAIDRVFVMSGFGAVATGTLVDGSLSVGQEVEIVPKGLRARVRGLQTHRKKLEHAGPGRRLAVNLSGVRVEDVERGDVIASPGWLTTTDALDVRVRIVGSAPSAVKHNATVTFFTATSETPAKLRLLDQAELGPGESGWAQLKLQRPVAVLKGDLFILRNSWGTVGGGQVVEPMARRHRRHDRKIMEHLELMEAGTPEEVVLEALMSKEPCQARVLSDATNLSPADVQRALDTLRETGQVILLSHGELDAGSLLLSMAGLRRMTDRLRTMLSEHHERFPLRKGMVKEEVRSRFQLPQASFGLLINAMQSAGDVVEDGPIVRLPDHVPSLTATQRQEMDKYLQALSASPYNPPSDVTVGPELLAYLVDEGQVVKTTEEVIFTAEAYRRMVDQVVERMKQTGKITVAEVRDMFGTSRKYVLALMEYLDQQRITRRVGDERVLR